MRLVLVLLLIGWHEMFKSVTKGAYHLIELAGPKELVLIGVNRKVKASPHDFSRDPCVEYTQELM